MKAISYLQLLPTLAEPIELAATWPLTKLTVKEAGGLSGCGRTQLAVVIAN